MHQREESSSGASPAGNSAMQNTAFVSTSSRGRQIAFSRRTLRSIKAILGPSPSGAAGFANALLGDVAKGGNAARLTGVCATVK